MQQAFCELATRAELAGSGVILESRPLAILASSNTYQKTSQMSPDGQIVR